MTIKRNTHRVTPGTASMGSALQELWRARLGGWMTRRRPGASPTASPFSKKIISRAAERKRPRNGRRGL